jgi:hypothetical protein
MNAKAMLLIAAATIWPSGVLYAATIDFEDIAVAPGTSNSAGDRISGGFLIDSLSNHSHLANDEPNGFFAANGTTTLTIDNFSGTNSATISPVGGGLFSLNRISLGESQNDGDPLDEATSVQFTGNLFGGGTLMTVRSLDGAWDGPGGVTDFQLETFSGWTNLTSLVLTGLGSGNGQDAFTFDNIQINAAIPEPSTYALMLAGLGFVGFVANRRRKSRASAAA